MDAVNSKLAHETYDCIIVGGGPAGATAATVLADHGRRVLVLEKTHFPRHHVGESLMPQTYHVFKRIGMLQKMKASDFPRKQSVQFVSASGKESQPYYFTDRDPNEWSITWQVTRDRFDQMMLDNAREHGAAVRFGATVKEVLFDNGKARGVVVEQDGERTELSSRVVVDASGLTALLSRRMGVHVPDAKLRSATLYAYFKGAERGEGRDAGATLIINTPDRDGWFWFIPRAGGITSVGIVAPPSYLCQGRGDDPARTLDEEIANTPAIAKRLRHAERVGHVLVTSDYSYCTRRPAGEGWVLIGDAFGFLDPVYSSGVMVAMKSGELAADAIHEGLERNDLSAAQLGKFARPLANGISLIKQLVYAFYDPNFSLGAFARKYPQYRDHIVRVLIGDVLNDDLGEMFDVMRDWVDLPERIEFEEGFPA